MGCDIHAVFQKQNPDESWTDIPCSEWNQDRHYFLFAWLANVRNGFGFAGVKTGNQIAPISEPRGLPEDFEVDDSYYQLGDHSHSWLTLQEIIDTPLPQTLKTGVISLEEYNNWDKVSTPESYCGGIFGGDIIVSIPECITPHTTHVQVEWMSSKDELKYFVDAIKNLVKQYGPNCRMVFGFDS